MKNSSSVGRAKTLAGASLSVLTNFFSEAFKLIDVL